MARVPIFRSLRSAAPLFALGIVVACAPSEPSINFANVELFKSSFAALKKSMSPADRIDLENAVFAYEVVEFLRVRPSEGQPLRLVILIDARVVPGMAPLSLDGLINATGQTLVMSGNVVDSPVRALREEGSIHHDDFEKIRRSSHPVDAAAERLWDRFSFDENIEYLQRIVDRGDEVVTALVDCSINRNAIKIKNESKWPITQIKVTYGGRVNREYKFAPPLMPGATSAYLYAGEALVSAPYVGRFPIDVCASGFELWPVDVIGRDAFKPMSRKEWLPAKQRLDELLAAKPDIAKSLNELMGWLRSIN